MLHLSVRAGLVIHQGLLLGGGAVDEVCGDVVRIESVRSQVLRARNCRQSEQDFRARRSCSELVDSQRAKFRFKKLCSRLAWLRDGAHGIVKKEGKRRHDAPRCVNSSSV